MVPAKNKIKQIPLSYVKFVQYGKDDTYIRNFTRSITYENAHKSIEN